jgi:6,7-dimethyl-8-ribityllumazine synthase
MNFANGVTRLVADLSTEYRMPVPYALVLLDYYGRELELGIAAGDRIRLARATADLQQTWNRFAETVLQRGAVDDARRMTDSVAQLVGARVPGDFVAPTGEELAAVDALKRLFKP